MNDVNEGRFIAPERHERARRRWNGIFIVVAAAPPPPPPRARDDGTTDVTTGPRPTRHRDGRPSTTTHDRSASIFKRDVASAPVSTPFSRPSKRSTPAPRADATPVRVARAAPLPHRPRACRPRRRLTRRRAVALARRPSVDAHRPSTRRPRTRVCVCPRRTSRRPVSIEHRSIDRCVSGFDRCVSGFDRHRSIDACRRSVHRYRARRSKAPSITIDRSIDRSTTRIDRSIDDAHRCERAHARSSIDRSMVIATRDTDRSIDRHERGDRSERTQGSIRWMVKGRHRSIDRSIDRHRVDVVHVHVHVHSAHARATSGPTTASTRSRGLRAHRLNLISG